MFGLLFEAEPVTNQGKPKREWITPSTVHDIHKVLWCAFNQTVKWEYKVMEFTDRSDIYDYYLMHCAIHLAFKTPRRQKGLLVNSEERQKMEVT